MASVESHVNQTSVGKNHKSGQKFGSAAKNPELCLKILILLKNVANAPQDGFPSSECNGSGGLNLPVPPGSLPSPSTLRVAGVSAGFLLCWRKVDRL